MAKLILINTVIFLNSIVSLGFFSDGLLKLIGSNGYSADVYFALFNACYVLTALVLAIGSYFWMSTIQLMSVTNNKAKFNWAKLFIILSMIIIVALSIGTFYYIFSQNTTSEYYLINQYSLIGVVCLIQLTFAFSCLKFVRRLRTIYGSGAKNLHFIKTLGILCIFASFFNAGYQILSVLTPNTLELDANSSSSFFDMLLWTLVNNGLNLFCSYIPMMFCLFVFRPVGTNMTDSDTHRSFVKQPLLSVKTTFVGSENGDNSVRNSIIDF